MIIFFLNLFVSIRTTNQRPTKSKIFNPNPTRKKFLIPETRPNPNPKKNFSNRNPTRPRKNFFFKLKPDANPKKYFLSTRNLNNFYFTISALNIFKTTYNIRISIGYKDNFWYKSNLLQDFNQASFNIFPKKSSFRVPDAGLCY